VPPVCPINRRIGRRQERVAGGDDVGAAEVHDEVAVGVAGRAIHENRIVVEVEIALFAEETCSAGARLSGDGPPGASACEAGKLLVGDDRGRVAVDRPAGARDSCVAADVIRIERGVDDPADFFFSTARRMACQDPVGRTSGAGVDDKDALVADLDDDIGRRRPPACRRRRRRARS